jgi:chemotaxis protein methyltransferase CheR
MGADSDQLSGQDFRRIASFVENYCGIKMPPTKKTMVEGRLRRRVRALGLKSLNDYCRALFDDGKLENEAVGLIDSMTTNKTEFFRELPHFRYLTEQVLPDLLSCSPRAGLDHPLKVWSAACSTGAEPYSLAMTLDDIAQSVRGFHFSVLATDISTEVLTTAVSAIYPQEMIAPIPEEMRRRYILRSRDQTRPTVRVASHIRTMVRFARLNLMDERYPVDGDMDIIFCRNILIYFDKPTQEAVVQRLSQHLRPGGYLFVGHTESIAGFKLPLHPVATAIFQRR